LNTTTTHSNATTVLAGGALTPLGITAAARGTAVAPR